MPIQSGACADDETATCLWYDTDEPDPPVEDRMPDLEERWMQDDDSGEVLGIRGISGTPWFQR